MSKQFNKPKNEFTAELATEIAGVTDFLIQQEDINLAILFVSLSTGNVHQESDIDIAIEKNSR